MVSKIEVCQANRGSYRYEITQSIESGSRSMDGRFRKMGLWLTWL